MYCVGPQWIPKNMSKSHTHMYAHSPWFSLASKGRGILSNQLCHCTAYTLLTLQRGFCMPLEDSDGWQVKQWGQPPSSPNTKAMTQEAVETRGRSNTPARSSIPIRASTPHGAQSDPVKELRNSDKDVERAQWKSFFLGTESSLTPSKIKLKSDQPCSQHQQFSLSGKAPSLLQKALPVGAFHVICTNGQLNSPGFNLIYLKASLLSSGNREGL